MASRNDYKKLSEEDKFARHYVFGAYGLNYHKTKNRRKVRRELKKQTKRMIQEG